MPESILVGAAGASGSVLTRVPEVVGEDGVLDPISLVAVTIAVISSSKPKLKGTALNLDISTRQNKFAMIAASDPSQVSGIS